MNAIIATESGGNPWAIHDNDGTLSRQPASRKEAEKVASSLVSAGHRVDMGLMQVDSKNLGRLHLTVHDIFEPCTNISAGASILEANYSRTAKKYGKGQEALLAAISSYNTGRDYAGVANGYVGRVLAHRGAKVTMHIPRIKDGAIIAGKKKTLKVDRKSPYNAAISVKFNQETSRQVITAALDKIGSGKTRKNKPEPKKKVEIAAVTPPKKKVSPFTKLNAGKTGPDMTPKNSGIAVAGF